MQLIGIAIIIIVKICTLSAYFLQLRQAVELFLQDQLSRIAQTHGKVSRM